MTTRDDGYGQLLTCDRCKVDFDFDDDDRKAHEITDYWNYEIFKNIKKPHCLWGDFCAKCATEMTPFVYALRDVVETQRFNNKLLKAIRERKANQNNRTNARPVSQGDAGCLQRNPEPRQGAGNPQTHKNYYGLALHRDEDCHV